MVDYVKDSEGVVHVVNYMGDAEFTFCARDMLNDGGDGGFDAKAAPGPATCKDCKLQVEKAQRSILGVRFA